MILTEQVGQGCRSLETHKCGIHLLCLYGRDVHFTMEQEDRRCDPVGVFKRAAPSVTLWITPVGLDHPGLAGLKPPRTPDSVDGVSTLHPLVRRHAGEKERQIVGAIDCNDRLET